MLPAARVTDPHVCPLASGPVPHVGGPILPPGRPDVLIAGLPAAALGDLCVCVGPVDQVVRGSEVCLYGGKPAARVSDQCAHGGMIVAGCPTVLIGTGSAGGASPSAGPQLAAITGAHAAAAPFVSRACDRTGRIAEAVGADDQPPQTSFVELSLADARGVPAAGAPVELVVDGAERRLRLDRNGRVRLDGIPPGIVTVRFPALGPAALDGHPNPTAASTGRGHRFRIAGYPLVLERSYHDDTPVCQAPFEVRLEDGALITGALDRRGRAELAGLPAKPVEARFGPDPRSYRLPLPPANPRWLRNATGETLAGIVEASGARYRAAAPEDRSTVSVVAGWLWGLAQGNFNQQQTRAQIVVDALISCIPLVGEATDVRDLVAIVFQLVDEPDRREDVWTWAELSVVLLGLIPVAGGAAKGVGKLLIRAPGGPAAARDAVAFLNRIGWGDAVAWLRKLDLERYGAAAVKQWEEMTARIGGALAAAEQRLGRLVGDDTRARLEAVRAALDELGRIGRRMIPRSLKELNARLEAARKQLYRGDWSAIPDTLRTHTREVEARLRIPEAASSAARPARRADHPKNAPNGDYPGGRYQPLEEFPDLRTAPPTRIDATGRTVDQPITAFSGPVRPVVLGPGTRIYRVIDRKGSHRGRWWTRNLPQDGRAWREDYAVLDRFSENGYYVEYVVPEGVEIRAWEGRAASQEGADGQYLRGGADQLYIDFGFSLNRPARPSSAIVVRPTNWSRASLRGVGHPSSGLDVEYLGDQQVESKFPPTSRRAGEVGKSIGLGRDIREAE